MLEHFMNGASHVINIFCDTPGCDRQDSVFCETREECVSVLEKRGWRLWANHCQYLCPQCARQKSSRKTEVSIYVIVASEHGEQKECIVLSNVSIALRVQDALSKTWGGENVTMASRAIDDIPQNIQRVL